MIRDSPQGTYGSSKLKLLPLQPFVGLAETNVTRITASVNAPALEKNNLLK